MSPADGVGPSADLRPDAIDVGAYVCAGCPEAVFDTAALEVGTETTLDISGKVDGQEGHGQFVGREARPAVNRALSQWKDLTAPRPVVRTGIPATGV